MKTSALRNAISIALFATLSGNAGIVLAREHAPDAARADAERQDGAGQGSTAASAPSKPASRPEATATELETVTVTGTRIRGGSTPSPVIAIGSEQIRQEGFSDLGEVIRSVPQNFAGGQNPGVIPFTISGAGTQNTNLSGGSALNLRGLGADATLTLLNGRRMAYDGISQAVDISAIPVDAVERIEIVPDGASAIYGSDAVGGVGNVILRRDFEGVTLGASYGAATDGGLATRDYSLTAGHVWSSGGLIVTYKDVTADPIHARQRAYTRLLRDPYTLYPGSGLRSGLVSLSQALGNAAELHLDALRTKRDQSYGAQDNLSNVYIHATPDATTTLLSPRLDIFLPNEWTLSLAATRSESRLDHMQSIEHATSGALLLQTRLCYCNEGRSYEAGIEGPLFALPAGDARAAVGVGRRENEFREYNKITDAAVIQGDEATRFAYAELHLPLLGETSTTGTGRRLAMTAAARYEDYDSFGGVLTPKLGVVYSPGTDLTLRASWGRSFKAPTLYQLNRQRATAFNYVTAYGGKGYPPGATALLIDGGNPNLEPERARTWSASLAVHPSAVPGLEAELTWFDIDYTDRVVAPVTPSTQALSNPAFAEFVTYAPTAEQQASAMAGGAFLNYIRVPYDPDNVVAMVHAYYTNVASQRIRGVDLSGSYVIDLGSGQLTLRGSSSWLRSSQQATAAAFDLAGTIHNPPKLVGRGGAVWARGGFSASVFAEYKQGVENVAAGETTTSFTTVDTTLRYAPTGKSRALHGWTVALSVQNVFNRPPPQHETSVLTPYLVPPYDATNYSAIGRFFNVSMSRHW
ncbi:TonB-dependent receptor [Stenotrophomonas sp. MYb238]|uniref:TonB-dependent receptor plug domain-containing protein n=1 Tax=Stenotrophomonas sp. MYb238 TaxID=2040281 RepID=UPI001291CB2B|nr:TonB-dependent receptor [Stenotrophomonas sp. MYb238]MQP74296.1 TonB-dependent receptor [Stenotrophomonas sp. MYb238]